jgi:hypothetical protein
MTPNAAMYVVGRESSAPRDYDAGEKPRLRSLVDQLTAAVADSEADLERSRAEASAEIAQLRRTVSDLEALLAAERKTTESLREDLAEAERQRRSAESARDDAVQEQLTITEDYESRLRAACEERDAERANVGARDQTIERLEAASASDAERHSAAIAQLRQQLEQLASEAVRWSSIVHEVERVLAAQTGHDDDRSRSAVDVSAPPGQPIQLDEDDEQGQANDSDPASSKMQPSSAVPAPEALPDSIDTYARQLLGTAEQMYEMDREAGRPAAEIVDRLVAHLRYARDVVVHRASERADGDEVFRRVLSALFNERWEHAFGRTLGFAMYELYADSNNAK